MQAGRELDALVAEKVMGWTGSGPCFNQLLDEEGGAWEWPNGDKSYLHRYSTDIAAAWQVVEKLKEQYRVTVTSPCDEIREWNTSLFHYGYRRFQDTNYSADAVTAPHAICLAALKAVGA